MHLLYDNWIRHTKKGCQASLIIFAFCLYNKQCSGSTHIAVNSHGLLPSALKSSLAPRGQMLRARALTTCLFPPFSGFPHSCCQDSRHSRVFLLLTQRWLWNQDKQFSSPASMPMLWHISQPSATLAVGKEHAIATTPFGEEGHQLGLWRFLRVIKRDSLSQSCCCCYRISEEMLPLRSHPGLLREVSASVTPHWGGQ